MPNTKSGEEVVQLYVAHPGSAIPQPIRELRGFERVVLMAGEQTTVELLPPAKSIAPRDASNHVFVTVCGKIEIQAGSFSADIHLKQTINVTN